MKRRLIVPIDVALERFAYRDADWLGVPEFADQFLCQDDETYDAIRERVFQADQIHWNTVRPKNGSGI